MTAEDYMDDLVAAWHESDGEQSLIDFLGINQTEYDEWVRLGTTPHCIVEEFMG